MFCENCGKEMQPGDKFCTTCGWKAPAEGEAQPAEAQVTGERPAEAQTTEAQVTGEQPVEAQTTEAQPAAARPAGEQPAAAQAVAAQPAGAKPKKKKKGIFFAAGAAVVLAAAGIAAAFNWSTVSNTFKKTFSSAADYYQYVEKENVDAVVASASTAYNAFLLEPLSSISDVTKSVTAGTDAGYAGEFTFTLGELGRERMKQEEPELFEILDQLKVNSATLYFESYMADNWMQGLIGVGLGEARVLSLDNIVNLSDDTIYLGIPELSEKYLGVRLADVIPEYETYLDEMKETTASLEMMEAIAKKLPDEKQAKELLARYAKVVMGCLDDVEKENGRKLEAGGVSQKYTRLNVNIDGKTFAKMAKALCDELADDKEFKKIFIDVAGEVIDGYQKLDLDDYYFGMNYDAEELYEAFRSGLEYVSENTDALEDSDFEMVMSVYVDGKGKIRGRQFTFEYDGVSMEITMAAPQDGKKTGYKAELSVTESGDEVSVVIEGSAEESGGKLDGEFELTASAAGEKRDILEVSVKSLDKADMEKGYVNGSFTVKPSKELAEEMPSWLSDAYVVLDVTSSEDEANVVVELAEDGGLWGSIGLSAKAEKAKKVSAPSNVIQINDLLSIEASLDEYLESIDWEGYKNTLKKAGIPEEWTIGLDELSDLSLEDLIWMLY